MRLDTFRIQKVDDENSRIAKYHPYHPFSFTVFKIVCVELVRVFPRELIEPPIDQERIAK